jgi:TIR domain
MEQDYIYDFFLSYRRHAPVGDWVKYHFYPLLNRWLAQSMPEDPKIFIDFNDIDTGSNWSARLRNGLKSSRCLIAVWSPDYFRSSWCLAECHSMMAREQVLGFRTDANPAGLIYPVVFSDGVHFPKEFQQIQQKNLKPWAISSLAFAETKEFVELEREVKQIAEELSAMLQHCPEWQEDFPIVEPQPNVNVKVKQPRL